MSSTNGLASLIPLAYSNVVLYSALAVFLLANAARGIRLCLPSNLMVSLEELIDNTEDILHVAQEDGLLSDPQFASTAGVSLTKCVGPSMVPFHKITNFCCASRRLMLQASILRVTTVRAARAFIPWRECLGFCMGLSLSIMKCKQEVKELRIFILVGGRSLSLAPRHD